MFAGQVNTKEYYSGSSVLKVFPNPLACHVFYIEPFDLQRPFNITLYNLQGKKLPVCEASDHEFMIETYLVPGIYLLKISRGQSVDIGRILIKQATSR
jgi:hypothetical protein